MKRFELNGKTYETDQETLNLLNQIIPTAKESGDSTAVMAVIFLGEKTGRVKEMKAQPADRRR